MKELKKKISGILQLMQRKPLLLLNEGVPDIQDRYSIQLDELMKELKCDPSFYQKQDDCLNQIKKQSQVQQPQEKQEKEIQSSECCLFDLIE